MATQCTAGMGHRPLPGNMCLPRIYSIGLLHCTPTVETLCWAWLPHGNLKAEASTLSSTNTQHNESLGGSTLIEKAHLKGTHDIIGIAWRRHLGLRLCCCSTVQRPSEPLVVSFRIKNHIMLTWCSYAYRGGRHCNSHSDGWCSGEHNWHRWGSSGCNNWRHNERHTTKRKQYYIQSPMVEDRNTSTRVKVNTSGGREPKIPSTQ